MATVFEVYTIEEDCSVVGSLWAKGLNVKDIHKEIFPVYGRSVSRFKRFTTGSRNSLKKVRKSQTTPDYLALLRLR
jgi:hypothetical protein